MAGSKQSIGKGFAILSTASIIVKLLSLIFVPLMVNILGEEGNGLFGVTYQVFAFVYVIANSGFPVAISKYVSELSERGYHASALKSFKISRMFLLILGSFLSILMALLAKPIASAMKAEQAWLGLVILAPSILFTSLLSSYRGYFQGRQNMVPTAVTQVIEQIVHIIFSSLCAFLGIKISLELGVAGSAIGTSLGAIAALILIILFFNHYVKKGQAVPPDSVRSVHSFRYLSRNLIKYAIPITISAAVTYGGNLIDAFIVNNRLFDSGLPENLVRTCYGFLTKFQQLINVPISLISALSIAMVPAIAASVAVADRLSAERKINYSLRMCYIIAVPAAFGLSVLSNGIYIVLHFGRGYEILLTGAFTLILTATVQIQTAILQSLNRLYYAIISLIAGILAKIVLNYTLIAIPSIRIYGALIGTYISMLITILLNKYILKKYEDLRFNLAKTTFKPLLSSICMITALLAWNYSIKIFTPFLLEKYITQVLLLASSVIIGIFIYFIAMAKTGGITKDILNSISPKIMRILPKFMKNMLR